MGHKQSALCETGNSILLLVDLQTKLAAAMRDGERAAVMRNAGILTQAARFLEVPVLYSEQYPKGLGPTGESLASLLPGDARRFEKTSFTCRGAEGFMELVSTLGRRQVVIAGMEAHVCVLQTALEMAGNGFEVFVAADAVCSRNPANRDNALARIRQAGVIVSNTESVVFEWLRDARHEHFKEISALVR